MFHITGEIIIVLADLVEPILNGYSDEELVKPALEAIVNKGPIIVSVDLINSPNRFLNVKSAKKKDRYL